MKQLCSYGCGNLATHKLKNGKYCCQKSPNQCPINRKKNSYSTKKSNRFSINANDIKIYCKWCGKQIGKCNIKKHEKSCYLNPINKKLCPVCKNPIKDYNNTTTCSPKCARQYFSEQYKYYGRKGKILSYRTICFDNHDKKCIICGEENIVEVHHYDNDHNNDDPSNLIPLCPTHHRYIRSKFEYLILRQITEYHNNIKLKKRIVKGKKYGTVQWS